MYLDAARLDDVSIHSRSGDREKRIIDWSIALVISFQSAPGLVTGRSSIALTDEAARENKPFFANPQSHA